MLFVITGRFRAGAAARREALHEEFNEHLMQRRGRVRFGGPLFDEAGERAGALLMVEAPDVEAARAFLNDSPYYRAGLYERTDIIELRPEVGRLA